MKPCPVTGRLCNKPKPFHITEIEKGKAVVTFDACQDCLAAFSPKGKGPPPSANKLVLDLARFFGHLLGKQVAIEQKLKGPGTKEIGCPNCGISLQKIMKEGKLGCPMCYENFDLQGILGQIHGSIKHVGKIPKNQKKQKEQEKANALKKLSIDVHIEQVETQMDLLAEVEDYEEAAKLRDTIQHMKALETDNNKLRKQIGVLIADEKFEEAQKAKECIEQNQAICLELRQQALSD